MGSIKFISPSKRNDFSCEIMLPAELLDGRNVMCCHPYELWVKMRLMVSHCILLGATFCLSPIPSMYSSKKSSSVPTTDGIKFTYCIPRFVICRSRERSDDEMVSFLTIVVSMAGLVFGLTRLSTRFGWCWDTDSAVVHFWPSSDVHSWWNGEMQSDEHSYNTALHDLAGRCPWSH
jgi:hypothetical protein